MSNMKKLFIIMAGVMFLTACGNSDQGGVVNDGMDLNDTDGALVDSTPGQPYDPAIDTSNMEDRVDIQPREKIDTSQLKSDSGSPAHKPVLH
jgi:hypothetical protein